MEFSDLSNKTKTRILIFPEDCVKLILDILFVVVSHHVMYVYTFC